jgi:hypothetical protein
MSQTLTFTLPTHLPIRQYAHEFEQVSEELLAIELELTGAREIDWIVDRVDAEGASVTLRAVGGTDATIRRVIGAYQLRLLHLGTSDHGDIHAAPTDVANGEHLQAQHSGENKGVSHPRFVSLGSLVGDVQPIEARGDASFVIREHVYRTLVHCYLADDAVVDVVAVAGKRVRVRGRVFYDHNHPHAAEVRDIHEVAVVDAVADRKAVWDAVRGILQPQSDAPRPEETIRRIRDEW